MKSPAKILVVDDTPRNVKLLADLLTVKGYAVVTAASGQEALDKIEREQPDLVLLDVVMPEMSGYEVCRKIREIPDTRTLPVVMVTALDPSEERIKGIEAGADDFLTKPINQAELLARTKSLLRIKELYDTVQAQTAELSDWNKTLQQRVEEQVTQLEQLGRLKRFFSPQLADLIVAGGAEDPLKTHRREVTVVFLDLRGFTAFAETAEPEEVMDILHEYHAAMGKLILEYEGTLEHFAGDGMMIFFNDPVPVENAAEQAARMALAMRERALGQNDLVARLAGDARLGLDAAALSQAFAQPLEFAGAAPEQTRAFVSSVESLVQRHPDAASRYRCRPCSQSRNRQNDSGGRVRGLRGPIPNRHSGIHSWLRRRPCRTA